MQNVKKRSYRLSVLLKLLTLIVRKIVTIELKIISRSLSLVFTVFHSFPHTSILNHFFFIFLYVFTSTSFIIYLIYYSRGLSLWFFSSTWPYIIVFGMPFSCILCTASWLLLCIVINIFLSSLICLKISSFVTLSV